MNDFTQELEKIEFYKKQGNFDAAWKLANACILSVDTKTNDLWYLMYYQMADILAREKKWAEALEKMGLMIHFANLPQGVGGITHQKFVRRLLRKFNVESQYDKYIELCKRTNPRVLMSELAKIGVKSKENNHNAA